MRNFLSEIRRRNVFKVAIVYIIAGWLTMQVADVMFPALQLPDWMITAVAVLVLIGFPFALILAWAFEITPEGIRREKDVDRSASIATTTGSRLNLAALLVLAAAVVFLLADRYVLRPANDAGEDATQTAAGVAADQPSIAVLPFVNMSADEDNEYFSDGLSEELLNVLAKIPELRVAGRTSSFAFKGKDEDLREIGRKLNVDHILEGSVRRSDLKLRITAQLIDTQNGYHLWSETYDRQLNDIFAIQDEISRAVADALEVTLLGKAGDRPGKTHDVKAYERFLQALYFFNHATEANFARAVDVLRQALAIDPNYADAWALLAEVRSQQVSGFVSGGGDFKAGYREVHELADRALAIDPDLAAGHLAKGLAYFSDRDFARSRAELERAASIEPANPRILRWLATATQAVGNLQEARRYVAQALEIEPLDIPSRRDLADIIAAQGDIEGALRRYRDVLEMSAEIARINARIAYCYLMQGDYGRAADYYAREPVDWVREEGEVLVATRTRAEADWRAMADAYVAKWGSANAAQFAEIFAFAGDADTAFEWIEVGYEVQDPGIIWLANSPLVAPIRHDARWAAHLARMGQHDDEVDWQIGAAR